MSGLNLDKVLEMVSDHNDFLKGDRNYSSYRLDIVLRVIHEHFKKTKDEESLPKEQLTQIFDNLAIMLPNS